MEVRPDWTMLEQINFPTLVKMSLLVGEPEDLRSAGALEYYDKVRRCSNACSGKINCKQAQHWAVRAVGCGTCMLCMYMGKLGGSWRLLCSSGVDDGLRLASWTVRHGVASSVIVSRKAIHAYYMRWLDNAKAVKLHCKAYAQALQQL